MLNIQFVKKELSEAEIADSDSSDHEVEYIVVNGIVDYESQANSNDLSFVTIASEEVFDIITKHTYEDLRSAKMLSISYVTKFESWSETIEIRVITDFDKSYIFIHCTMEDLKLWSKNYSISKFKDVFRENAKKYLTEELNYLESENDETFFEFGLELTPQKEDTAVQNDLDKLAIVFKQVLDEVNLVMLGHGNEGSLFQEYIFPESIRVACNQYLTYFAQFLNDLGIDADIELKQSINHTLFKVTPTDQNESLQKIKEALDIYLNSPDQSNFANTSTTEKDIAVQQWASQVFFLQSQLMLAKSTIQAQETTIANLQFANYELVNPRRLSGQDTSPPEKIVWGLVTIKKFDAKFAEFDLPEIYRRLKRLKDSFK